MSAGVNQPGHAMRSALTVIAIGAIGLLTILPDDAAAADRKARGAASRDETVVRVVRPAEEFEGRATLQRPRIRGVAMEQVAGERRRVYDADGMPMTRSYVLSEPPRRVEKRVYVRDDESKPFALLYGGFYGSHRWGVSREGW